MCIRDSESATLGVHDTDCKGAIFDGLLRDPANILRLARLRNGDDSAAPHAGRQTVVRVQRPKCQSHGNPQERFDKVLAVYARMVRSSTSRFNDDVGIRGGKSLPDSLNRWPFLVRKALQH